MNKNPCCAEIGFACGTSGEGQKTCAHYSEGLKRGKCAYRHGLKCAHPQAQDDALGRRTAKALTCAACRYWLRHGPDAVTGDCRRHAPTRRDSWAETGEDEWCGDVEARAVSDAVEQTFPGLKRYCEACRQAAIHAKPGSTIYLCRACSSMAMADDVLP